jgi:hypothetical protein
MLGQVGEALDVQPGEEFRVALIEAQRVHACCCCPTSLPSPSRRAQLAVLEHGDKRACHQPKFDPVEAAQWCMQTRAT